MTDAIVDVGARMNSHKGLAKSVLSKRLLLLAHVGYDIWYGDIWRWRFRHGSRKHSDGVSHSGARQ